MGTTKTAEYSIKELNIAKYAKALSHPARIAILNLLLKKQTCICGDIVDDLPLSQSTVSQHLKELKEAGLIKGNIDGASVCYCIDEKEWIKAQAQLNVLFEKIEVKSANCCS
jgi:DNA-binding transcriptional ArsR family regulator